MLKENKKLLLVIIFALMLVIGIVCILLLNPKNREKANTNINNIDSSDYEIAKILFANFFEDEFDESKISEANYEIYQNHKEFSCTYIMKQYEDPWMIDQVTIKTFDFVTYYYLTDTYEYNEETDTELYPRSSSSPYEALTNEEKNRIITIANYKGYDTAPNPSDQEFLRILEIIFLNDKTNLKEIINNGNYILKNYYLSSGQIYFRYMEEGNESNDLDISSWVNYSTGWNIDVKNENNIYGNNKEVFEFENMFDGKKYYCIDYDVEIEEYIDEMKSICSKYGFE